MPSYVLLLRFTHRGVPQIKESPARYDALRAICDRFGAKIKDIYVFLGQSDTLIVAEAPNDDVIAKLSLYFTDHGDLRVETHRVYSEAEFRKLVLEME
jgi:uncharacterized protein with GYD domain